MELLPAIDLRHGRAVRLRQGNDARATVYGDDPVAVLESYARAGVARVHVVDLDAAFGERAHRKERGCRHSHAVRRRRVSFEARCAERDHLAHEPLDLFDGRLGGTLGRRFDAR